jgi:hypothetical protein
VVWTTQPIGSSRRLIHVARRRSRVIALCAGALALALVAGCHDVPADPGASDPRTTSTSSATPAPSTATSEPSAASATSELLFTGNTSWARYVEDWSRASPRGIRYPFSRLDEFHRSEYDAWITGLECPIVAGLHVPSSEQDRLLRFNCDPGFLSPVRRWFTAVSLATNHTQDHGLDALAETRRHLEENGIQWFGDPDPRRLATVCSAVVVPVSVLRSDGSRTRGWLPVGMCGFDGVFRLPLEAALDRMQAVSRLLPVFALPHNGLEYTATPDDIKVAFDRSLVDHGADVVLGDHPHWVQPTEAWHGHLIVYSMGNFIFDQQDDAEVTRSAAIRVRLTVDDPEHLDQWLEIGAECAATGADCLSLVRAAGLPKLDYNLDFGVVGSSNTGRVTHRARPAQDAAIRARLDWRQTMSSLEPPYGSLERQPPDQG